MAGAEHLISVPDSIHPWKLVFEVAEVTSPEAWVLVGGMMVHAHAVRAGVTPPRPTSDVDLLLNIAVARVSDVAAPLQRIGFRPYAPPGSGAFHRFIRGEHVLDMMVARGASGARWLRRPVLQAPGARQALERRDDLILEGVGRQARIGIPDSLGAIVAKAAAYAVDQRDRNRHLEDIAVLLASAGGRRGLDAERLTSRDRRHLRPATAILRDDRHEAWSVLDEYDRAVGQRALSLIFEASEPAE